MKAIYSLKIYDKRIKNLLDIIRISYSENKLPYYRKFIRSSGKMITLGRGKIITKISNLFWIKEKNGSFLNPRYIFDYKNEETIAEYNLDEGIEYIIKDFDRIFIVMLNVKTMMVEEIK